MHWWESVSGELLQEARLPRDEWLKLLLMEPTIKVEVAIVRQPQGLLDAMQIKFIPSVSCSSLFSRRNVILRFVCSWS